MSLKTFNDLLVIMFSKLQKEKKLHHIYLGLQCEYIIEGTWKLLMGVARIWQGEGQEYFFSDLEIYILPYVLLGGLGACPPKNFFKMVQFVTFFCVYLDQILSLNNFKITIFIQKFQKFTIF